MVAVSGSMFPMGIAPNDSARVYESPDESARRVGATVQVVDYDFLDTLAVDMVAGRAFSREFGDDVSDAARPTAGNIIVDEAMVERMGWASTQAAIGKTLYVPGLANGIGPRPTASTVVGVAIRKFPCRANSFSYVPCSARQSFWITIRLGDDWDKD